MSSSKKPGASAPTPNLEEFAFESKMLGLDLPSYDALLSASESEDRATLAEARDLALAAHMARDKELFEARIELMCFKALVYGLTPKARRDVFTQKARSKGATEGNKSRAKLPPGPQLILELANLQANGNLPVVAKAMLSRRYGVTRQGLGQALKKAKTS